MPTLENRKKIVDAYLDAFQKTPLVMLINGEECTSMPRNMARAGEPIVWATWVASSPTWYHMRDGLPKWIREANAWDAWKTAPVAWEPAGPCESGWTTVGRCGASSTTPWPCMARSSTTSPARCPQAEIRPEVERFLRRLGYRLVLKELKHPASVRPDDNLQLTMKWQNVGSAPCYKPYRLAYRLANDQGYEKVFVGTVTVNKWLPGSIELFTEEFFKEPADLPLGEVVDVADSIQLPHDLSPGTYTLSIAVVGTEDTKPIVRLGIKGRSEDGWYPLSTVNISR